MRISKIMRINSVLFVAIRQLIRYFALIRYFNTSFHSSWITLTGVVAAGFDISGAVGIFGHCHNSAMGYMIFWIAPLVHNKTKSTCPV